MGETITENDLKSLLTDNKRLAHSNRREAYKQSMVDTMKEIFGVEAVSSEELCDGTFCVYVVTSMTFTNELLESLKSAPNIWEIKHFDAPARYEVIVQPYTYPPRHLYCFIGFVRFLAFLGFLFSLYILYDGPKYFGFPQDRHYNHDDDDDLMD